MAPHLKRGRNNYQPNHLLVNIRKIKRLTLSRKFILIRANIGEITISFLSVSKVSRKLINEVFGTQNSCFQLLKILLKIFIFSQST